MEQISNAIRDFIIDDLGEYLEPLAEADCPLPAFTDKNCVCTAIDFSKYQMNQVCFILPDIQNINPLSIDETEVQTNVDVFIFCSGKPAEILYKQALRYGAALKKLVKDNYSMDGAVTQSVVTQFEFFEDVGANDKRMTGVKLTLTLLTEE